MPCDRSRATRARLQGERSEKQWQSSSRMRPLTNGRNIDDQAERSGKPPPETHEFGGRAAKVSERVSSAFLD